MSANYGLVVESPNKVAKIQGFLDQQFGKGVWKVASSVGHIRDLPDKELGIERNQDYKRNYVINPDKKQIVRKLIDLAQEVGSQNMYLATDPDREGEAIAYHISMALKMDLNTAKRVTFNEITPKAIIQSIQAGVRTIDKKLVLAQEARRVIDRLAGFEVSGILIAKLGERLSAGRVQSPALRLTVERERAINGFKDTYAFKLKGTFLTNRNETIVALYQQAMADKSQVQQYFSSLGEKTWSVKEVEVKPTERNPSPAFTTSTLQQDAIRKLGSAKGKWTAKKVMEVAQKLFEQGHITYMRTDSPNLSQEAIDELKGFITKLHGATYFQARTFKAKESAQEAHEAIRPTHFDQQQAGETDEEKRLYRLIYDRAMASQMKPAIVEKTTITITSQIPDDLFIARASVIKFDGFLKVYDDHTEEDSSQEETQINAISKGERLKLDQLVGRQTYAQPPKRYDEASLVAELEKKGIGRPSTYASILGAISSREYVVSTTVPPRKRSCQVLTWKQGNVKLSEEEQSIGGDKNKLVPTETGQKITQFLEEHFTKLVNYDFTADMETDLDRITEGKATFLSVVKSFDTYHTQMLSAVNQHLPNAERKQTQFTIGELDGHPVKTGLSKKSGVYILYQDEFYSIPANIAPQAVTLEMAREAIAAKRQKAQQLQQNTLRQIPGKGVTYSIRRGEYGLYLTDGSSSASLKHLSNESDVDTLTAEDCKTILNEHKQYKKSQGSQPSSARPAFQSNTKTKGPFFRKK